MTTPKDLLKAARAKIENPENWTKGRFSTKVNGKRCFCAMGALYTTAGEDLVIGPFKDALDRAVEELNIQAREIAGPNVGVITYNDDYETTHADILAVFDRAIEAVGE